MEFESRAQVTEEQASSLLVAISGWSRPIRVIDIVFGRSGVSSMQADGWVIRLRKSDAVRRLEYKSATDASHRSWEELGITVDNLAVAADILVRIGLKPGLVIDRQRCTCRLPNAVLTLDKVRFLGSYLEIETTDDACDPRSVLASLGDQEPLRELLFDAPPYGQMLRQKRVEDRRVTEYEREVLAALRNDAVPPWHFEV
jgi:adenylate cyclase class IV